MRSRLLGIVLLACVGAPQAAALDDMAGAVARPAVDPRLFRDGEVKRHNERFARWSLDCDEIARLGQRFCSLRTLAIDEADEAVARITISTDERGRPAALVDLPLGLDLTRPVEVEAQQGLVLGKPSSALAEDARKLARGTTTPRRSSGKAEIETELLKARLRAGVCDRTGCHAVWTLAPAEVAALRAGAGLQVRFFVSRNASGWAGFVPARAVRARKGLVSSDGFGEALQASLR